MFVEPLGLKERPFVAGAGRQAESLCAYPPMKLFLKIRQFDH